MIGFSDQVKVLLKMKKTALTYGRLTQGQDEVRLIRADRRVVVIVGALLYIVADIWIVLELDFVVLQKSVALVFFGVG